MRQLRYSVAASLDGYIAGPNGEFDWIVVDPEIDFAAMYARFSGLVMGRRSYDVFLATGGGVGPPLPTYVYSRTLGTERTRSRSASTSVPASASTVSYKPPEPSFDGIVRLQDRSNCRDDLRRRRWREQCRDRAVVETTFSSDGQWLTATFLFLERKQHACSMAMCRRCPRGTGGRRSR
jgi:hypothetical protein